MQLFACDDMPGFCAYCGSKLHLTWPDSLDRQDYYAQCSHHCPDCHAKYVHIPAAVVIQTAADMGSDIAQYVKA